MTSSEILSSATVLPPIQLAALLALVALVPLLLLSCSCFLRIVIVLNILRTGFGVQQVLPGVAVSTLALLITLMVMAPVGMQVGAALKHEHAERSLLVAEEQQFPRLLETMEPLRRFLRHHTAPPELEVVLSVLNAKGIPVNALQSDLTLVAGFVLTELRKGFAQGFILLLPLLVVDIVIAIIAASLGLTMLNPQSVALPAKLLLFTASDGWNRILQSLAQSYSGAP